MKITRNENPQKYACDSCHCDSAEFRLTLEGITEDFNRSIYFCPKCLTSLQTMQQPPKPTNNSFSLKVNMGSHFSFTFSSTPTFESKQQAIEYYSKNITITGAYD